MIRVKFSLPKRDFNDYRHLDILHDALVEAWKRQGVPFEKVCGQHAQPWCFAPLGFHKGKQGRVHTLVVSTPSTELANALAAMKPEDIAYSRAKTGELIDFSAAVKSEEPDPIAPNQGSLGILMLSPLALRDQDRKWHADLSKVDLAAALNYHLGKSSGRTVNLRAQADSFYIRLKPRHSVLVSMKGGEGVNGYVIGMQAPLVLAGSDDDLRLAWYSGLGSKTRNGFGCIGLLEQGVGR